ncbi:UNVERIFIED_ORG: type IV secretion system protein VirB2 [Rhizobium sp. SORGH_AS260]|uniref:TrbC/VirB2 family protein n=1 Tax=Agrobacterium sp. SORGH_AS_0440 TaxID=3041757 RepID=UPI001150F523|nr:TrbC/VirB2 family protein [Agrobacterium sp. SORGH_AS_0440]MDP9734746.1 type IV secretion system protein VirB2 [Rhizobium sp. SORGH_AS_0285]MDP9756966.1 type IV secretion system protein VirB2 [Rhizobium sp. SORGH_AS_0260]MDR6083785.1 type IV secretion system protein VirB2 [Agrobacterium sp. SORGH_AS_0440]
MSMKVMAILVSSVTCRSLFNRKWAGNVAMVLLAASILFVSQYEPAAAQSLDALENAADRLVQFFTGPFGRSVGAIAFIGMFLAAAFGFWSWGALLRVGGSLAGMFAAAELVDFLAGSGS